jgi:catechol 2,3-dioxygenase-like lactoylglutathione lyase family enzyme
MNLGINGGLMFMYYDGIEDAARFYEDVLGFEVKLDSDWVKILKYAGDCHVGLVDVSMGSHKVMEEKSARLQLMVNDAQSWWDYIVSKGLKPSKDELVEGKTLKIKVFAVTDPGGYTVEFCEYTAPYGEG